MSKPTQLPSHTDDEVLIRNLCQSLLQSWGNGDGHAYAAHFTEDSDYIAFDGTHYKGREENAIAHQYLFETWLKDTRLAGQVERIRFLSRDVAIVHLAGGMLMTPKSMQAKRPSIQTLVAVKQDGNWQFTAFHNCRIQQRNGLQNILFGIATRIFHL
ncbi:SgcJ/EcaC family oxidoreductase [Phormidium tenue FACHB-886]|nr:SgcJ/EcaC family oxidoreductase [Phormidium tenue FACHB-886]